MASKQITRRDFIRTTAAGALATGLGAPFIVPQRSYGASAKKRRKILQWVHFVPAFDKWFNEKYVKEWGDKNNTEVTVDNIGIAGLTARAAAEVSAQKGHDLFLFNWPPPFLRGTSGRYEGCLCRVREKIWEAHRPCHQEHLQSEDKKILRLLPLLYAGPHKLAQGPLGRRRSHTR